MIDSETIAFVKKGYDKTICYLTEKQIIDFLELFKDNTVIVNKDGNIIGIGFYLRLNDWLFEQIKNRQFDIRKPENIIICFDNEGSNIHFIGVVANSSRVILKGLRKVIKTEAPKSISWFSPNMEDFFTKNIVNYKEMLICHH